jgi:hypothetical protein
MDRSNHYEAAFEAYLQDQGYCYVAVDESRRARLGEDKVKSLDFIVYGPCGARLLVDVKGRRFPTGKPAQPRRVWECWSTREDVESLEQWADVFGPGYQGLLVFAYHLLPGVRVAEETDDLWTWRGRRYLLRGIATSDYRDAMVVRSPRWGTVTLGREDFRRLVRPLTYFVQGPSILEECPF